jgi:SAM-dependent methyltransferase
VRPGERVLDVGCGAGQTSLQAAEAGAYVLGVDVSAEMLERARERVPGVEFVLGDAQTHPLERGSFDAAISRCGLMFFSAPVAAFTNIRRALRPGGRLVALVWQGYARNEWATALGVSPEPFSLADPETTRGLLERAGFRGIGFEDVHEPVFYGADVDAAFEWARPFAALGDEELREILAAHATADGVFFDSRAWIVSATSA